MQPAPCGYRKVLVRNLLTKYAISDMRKYTQVRKRIVRTPMVLSVY